MMVEVGFVFYNAGLPLSVFCLRRNGVLMPLLVSWSGGPLEFVDDRVYGVVQRCFVDTVRGDEG